MTVHTDLASLAPTATAQRAFLATGVSATGMIAAIQQQAIELSIAIKQLIAFHPNDSVLSATVAAGGSGGTNGPVTLTGTTGTGTRFTAKGVISSGVLSGAITIVTAGSYSVDPTTPTAEPVTGGSLSGATLALTMSGDLAVLTSLQAILAELA
jgi:hypothetical protein